MSHIHVLGIGGTFMAGLAVLARAAGHTVTGQDAALYPPMSEVLDTAGIPVTEGFEPVGAMQAADTVVIGNALSRGNPAVEAALDAGLNYTSGPAWLATHILHERWVIAVAGTHGKTTTASLIAWLLEDAGLEPGFLIGGLPGNFTSSARLGAAPFFVIEADEYDTAFFDKRSKFVHFRPRTLVLNNLEFDHGDIFPDLAAIERQFQHLVRTVPGTGGIVVNRDDAALERVLDRGCWSECIGFGRGATGEWPLAPAPIDDATPGRAWTLGEVPFKAPLAGAHNAMNSAAALLAARHAGVPMANAVASLAGFRGVRRRLELRGTAGGVRVLDDFAHHPTAIAASLAAVRTESPNGRVIAVLEPRSNTMRAGLHGAGLGTSLQGADAVFMLTEPGLEWDTATVLESLGERLTTAADVSTLVAHAIAASRPGDTLLVMSNGAFGGIHERLLNALDGGPSR